MPIDTKKATILAYIKQQNRPVAIGELDAALTDYPRRSLSRWLTELVELQLLQRIGAGKSTQYALPKSAHMPTDIFSPAAQSAIDYVNQDSSKRDPIAYQAQWLENYIPNKTFYFTRIQLDQLWEAGNRQIDNDPAGTFARQIYNRLLIDLSYNSSRLEGNTYSRLDTERLLIKGNPIAGKLDEETIMILNHKEAIRRLVEKSASMAPSSDEVCTLHFLLSDGLVEPRYAGAVRTHAVLISHSTYIPYENSTVLATQLNTICDKAAQIQDPFEQSLFLLIHIAYLQAFIDVNKRTARIACNIPLIKHNLVPLSFNDVNKDDYIAAMIAIYELNDPQALIDLYLYSYLRSCQYYTATVQSMGFDLLRVKYRQQRRDTLRHIILARLVAEDCEQYIVQSAKENVPDSDRAQFIENIHEDLNLINQNRIAGLGITQQQFELWFSLFKRS